VLSVEKLKLHLREIAQILVARYPAVYGGLDLEDLGKKVGQSISNHIRSAKRKAKISKVPNGKGRHLSGVYKTKQKRKRQHQQNFPKFQAYIPAKLASMAY
jgi:hypothetical protein